MEFREIVHAYRIGDLVEKNRVLKNLKNFKWTKSSIVSILRELKLRNGEEGEDVTFLKQVVASTFNSSFMQLIEKLGKRRQNPELIDQCMVGLETSLLKFDFNKSFVLEELLGFIKCEVFEHIEAYERENRKFRLQQREIRNNSESNLIVKKKPGRVDYRSQEYIDYFLQKQDEIKLYLKYLNKAEQCVLIRTYGLYGALPVGFIDIGSDMGITRELVRYNLKRAINKLNLLTQKKLTAKEKEDLAFIKDREYELIDDFKIDYKYAIVPIKIHGKSLSSLARRMGVLNDKEKYCFSHFYGIDCELLSVQQMAIVLSVTTNTVYNYINSADEKLIVADTLTESEYDKACSLALARKRSRENFDKPKGPVLEPKIEEAFLNNINRFKLFEQYIMVRKYGLQGQIKETASQMAKKFDIEDQSIYIKVKRIKSKINLLITPDDELSEQDKKAKERLLKHSYPILVDFENYQYEAYDRYYKLKSKQEDITEK